MTLPAYDKRFVRASRGEGPINRIWPMNLTGKIDVRGQLHMMLGAIDHGSRRLLALAALPNKMSFTLLGHLFLAIGKYGKPRFVRTDNESVLSLVCSAGRSPHLAFATSDPRFIAHG